MRRRQGRSASVRGSKDNLVGILLPEVSHRKDTGNVRLTFLIGDDITAGVLFDILFPLLQCQMPADCRFESFFAYRSPLHENLIGQHQGRSGRQAGCRVFGRSVGISGFGDDFDLQIVCVSQPGKHVHVAFSGLALRVVEKYA
jgi:hypothetical protein